MPDSKPSAARKICSDLLLALCLLLLLMLMLGFRVCIVQSGSMYPTFDTGAAVLIDTRMAYDQLQCGDIIVYKRGDMQVIHRVIAITDEGLTTKGDANNTPDSTPVTADTYTGVYRGHIEKAGYVLRFFQTPLGLLLWLVIQLCLAVFFRLPTPQKEVSAHACLEDTAPHTSTPTQ